MTPPSAAMNPARLLELALTVRGEFMLVNIYAVASSISMVRASRALMRM